MADLTDLFTGYQRASRFAPVERSTVETALKPYNLEIAALSGKSDRDLRRMAAAAVLARRRARLDNPTSAL